MFGFHGWSEAYKSATTCFTKNLSAGYYTRSQFLEAVAVATETLTSFIDRAVLSRADMFEGVPDHLLDSVQEFIEEVLTFYETLCLIAQHPSIENIVPLELVFTDSGYFHSSVWYRTSTDLFESPQSRVFLTLTQSSSQVLNFKTWSGADRQEACMSPQKMHRYPVPLAPTLGLHKTVSNVLCDLVKSFFAKKKHAHINIRDGTYVGSEEFADFIVGAKTGSSLVLFDQDCGGECVDFLVNGGLAAYASSKAASHTTLKALSFLLALDSETLKLLCLKAFYGPYLSMVPCSYVEPEVEPLYNKYSHLNRQYTGLTLNGKSTNSGVRFSVSMVPSDKAVPVYLMKAEPSLKTKVSSVAPSVPDLDNSVQSPPLRNRV